jgi:hypothetical protein
MFRPVWPPSGAFLGVTDAYSTQCWFFNLHHGSKMLALHRKMSYKKLKVLNYAVKVKSEK